MIQLLFNVVAPVFIIVSIGWGWARLGRLYNTSLISSLVMTIGAPCLVFATLNTMDISAANLGEMGVAAVLVIVLTGLIGLVILRVTRQEIRTFLPPLMFPNGGNRGWSLCLCAFGQPGLAFAIIVFSIYCLFTFSIGIWIYSGTLLPRQLLKQPIIYSVMISVTVLLTGVDVPNWILKTTSLLGNFTIPLMLFTLGVSLSGFRVTKLKRAVLLSLLRLGVGFGIGIFVSHLLGLTGIARGVIVLQSSMPVAVFNYLFAETYNRNPKETAELVVISTFFSLVTIPLILLFLN
jgi:predicted permease